MFFTQRKLNFLKILNILYIVISGKSTINRVGKFRFTAEIICSDAHVQQFTLAVKKLPIYNSLRTIRLLVLITTSLNV